MRIALSVNLTKRTLIITDQDDFVRGCGTIHDGEIDIQSCSEPEICMGTFYTRGTFISIDLKEVPYGSDIRLAAIVRTLAKCCKQVTIRFATT
jgi:hypothetical protein